VSLTSNPAHLAQLDPETLQEVRACHRGGRLGLLAGAGLSAAIGLPPWHDFNLALLQHSLPCLPDESLTLARAYLEQIQGHSLAAVDFARLMAGSEFHRVLRRALYERPALRSFRPTEVHHALAALAVESRPPFPCIHTTNYDDLIELALTRVASAPVAAVHSARRRAADGPRVVHLHGYFPFRPASGPNGNEDERKLARTIVASESDYHVLSNDHVAWTNRELLSLLETRSALIVGTSLADPNLRRLLAHLAHQRATGGRPERHYVVMQSRDGASAADRLVARAAVILGRSVDDEDERRGVRRLAQLAARILEKNEREFWDAQGVKIINVESYDRLGYLLRRIRFSDDEWDEAHRRVRAAWARRHYGEQDFDDPVLQDLCTHVLGDARDRLREPGDPVRLRGELELNVFLPLADGSYRRAFSSVRGRASAAPRRFHARHDRFTIPEVERVLTLGAPVTSPKVAGRAPPPGEPPFSTWYRSIEGVPYFDYDAGGIPVAVLQLCSSEEGGAARELDVDGMTRLRGYLGSIVTSVLSAVKGFRGER
jgi:hypothetical protein